MTTIVEAPRAAVTKQTKDALPPRKRKVPEHIAAAADAAERRSKGLPLDKPKVRARGRREKSTLDAARVAVAEERAKRDAKAPVKTKAEPKAKPEPKPRKVSAMQVIRRTLAHNHNATVEEISKACKAAGVEKADGTIQTIRSDFMQTYAALLEAGRIKT